MRNKYINKIFPAVLAVLVAVTTATLPLRAEPPSSQAAEEKAETLRVGIEGMACPFCAYGIEKQLRKIKGVKKAEVDFNASEAVLTLEPGAQVTEDQIEQAVKKAGFKVSEVKGLEKSREKSDEAR